MAKTNQLLCNWPVRGKFWFSFWNLRQPVTCRAQGANFPCILTRNNHISNSWFQQAWNWRLLPRSSLFLPKGKDWALLHYSTDCKYPHTYSHSAPACHWTKRPSVSVPSLQLWAAFTILPPSFWHPLALIRKSRWKCSGLWDFYGRNLRHRPEGHGPKGSWLCARSGLCAQLHSWIGQGPYGCRNTFGWIRLVGRCRFSSGRPNRSSLY